MSSLKVNSSLRFPEGRRLLTDIDSFLIDPVIREDVKKHSSEYTPLPGPVYHQHQEGFSSSLPAITNDTSLSWSVKTQKIKEGLHKEIRLYRQSIALNEKQLQRRQMLTRRLLHYAKVSPLLAAEAINNKGGGGAGMNQWIAKDKLECVASVKDDKRCGSVALPYSRFCLEHILLDDKQVLYRQCEATDSVTSKQCGKPVLEILQDKPYCRLHMKLVPHSNELKKTSSKLSVPSAKGATGRRKGSSPSRLKKQKAETKSSNKPSPLSLSLLPSSTASEPLLTQASAPTPAHSRGATWSSTSDNNNIMDMKKPQAVEMMGDNNILHVPITPTLNNDMPLSFGNNDAKNDSLLPFSPDPSVNSFSCPPLPPAPQVGLFPFDSALMGNILDNSSDED